MEEALLVAGLVLGTPIILAVIAWARSNRLARELSDVRTSLNLVEDRIRALEVINTRRRTPEPAAAPPPVAETAPPPAPVKRAEPAPETAPAPARLPAPDVAPPPAAIPQPSFVDDLATPVPAARPDPVSAFLRWLTQGNPLAKLGVLLMFFGLAYLLHYANEHGMLSIESRLVGAAAIALVLLAVGWRLRLRSPVYALTLQGGSIGALYLTSFAAFRVYALLPHGLVFALLVVICAACVALAVLQRAQSLAFLASLGGYLAPVLLSTGGGSHIALFSYYALLSAGILAVSIWQVWRPLNLIGFAFTFGVGALWGVDRYEPSLYAGCQFFLALNLIIYGVLAALAPLRHNRGSADAFVDGTLVFGAPIVGFGLQVGMTNHREYGAAFSALGFAALYLPLAWILFRRQPERARRLTLAFLALGSGFATLSIPLALAARWTSLAWSLEGLGILWLGRAQRDRRMTGSGTLLLVLAAGAAWKATGEGIDTPTFLLVTAVTSLAWLAGAWLWRQDGEPSTTTPSRVLLAGGVIGWLVLIVDGSERLAVGELDQITIILFATSVTVVIWRALGRRLAWPELVEATLIHWPVAALSGIALFNRQEHFIDGWPSALACLITMATAWHLLRAGRDLPPSTARSFQHTLFWWLLIGLINIEAWWRLRQGGWGTEEWLYSGLMVTCAGAILIVSQMARRNHWAPAKHPVPIWAWGLMPAVLGALGLLAVGNLLDGRVPGFPYIPLINPVEEGAAFALVMLVVWMRAMRTLVSSENASFIRAIVIALVVWWMNGVFLRTIAAIAGVSWNPDALWESAEIQTSMAIVWTIAALVCMTVAARRATRQAWFAGAVALAAVVVKLFLVDSARGGGIARAVAFIGVAALILLIGYVAPLPPKAGREESVTP